MSAEWDGITQTATLRPEVAALRHQLADGAKAFAWQRMLEILYQHPSFTNTTRPSGKSLYAPLHQAAYGGAPVEVVQQLLRLGAWRTLRNAKGEQPVDVATQKGHLHLIQPLEPVYKHSVSLNQLQSIQTHFHAVIRGRAQKLIEQHLLRLPELEPLLELKTPQMWFPVPGMFGGFNYWLEGKGSDLKLVTESWCRVVGGSGQRHEVTAEGNRLVEQGFV